MFSPRSRQFMKSGWKVPVLGILFTLVFAWASHVSNSNTLQRDLRSISYEISSEIVKRFTHFQYGLRGARGSIVTAGPNAITREQFKRYVSTRDIQKEFPGALGFGFIELVPPEGEEQFVAAAREDGAPNFSIRTLEPHYGDRFVIKYIYPEENNTQAIGLDIGSEASRRKAAIEAAQINQPRLTAPITLVQKTGKPKRGALILLPIYAFETNYGNSSNSMESVIGWSYAPLIIDEVLNGLKFVGEDVQISLTERGQSNPFYTSGDQQQLNHNADSFRQVFDALGQLWEIEVAPTDGMLERVKSNSVVMIVLFGFGLTLVVTIIMGFASSKLDHSGLHDGELSDTGTSITGYFRREGVARNWKRTLIIALLVFLAFSWQVTRNELDKVYQTLSEASVIPEAILRNASEKYERDVLFISDSPPIIGLIDSVSDVGAENSRRALEEVIKAYMISDDQVYQTRLIEFDKGWKETIKVQREGKNLKVFDQFSLQEKKGEPYIASTLNVGNDNVYISPINLNREYGEIEIPHRPVWRFSTPVFRQDGTPFGIFIMNINVDSLLERLVDMSPQGVTTYLTDVSQSFLMHPNPALRFGDQTGVAHRWSDEFEQDNSFLSLFDERLMSFSNSLGSVFAFRKEIRFEGNSSARVLSVTPVLHRFPVITSIATQIGAGLLFLTVFLLAVSSFQYWVWVTAQAKQRSVLQGEIEARRNREIRRFQSLLDSAPDAMIIVDETGIIQTVNERALKFFGYAREELEGQPVQILVPEMFRSQHVEHIQTFVSDPKPRPIRSEQTLHALNSNGEEIPVDISLGSVRFEEELLVTAAVRDISARLEIEEKLRQALEQAELATQAKSAFLANTSHEIRTPLNAVIGLTHLLMSENLSHEQRQLVRKISISGKSLLGIINDVLDLSKIEADQMDVENRPLDVVELVEDLASIYEVQTNEKGVRFKLEVSKDVLRWIRSDSTRLKQILANLLSNALKFTSFGEITLKVEMRAGADLQDENEIDLIMKVRDSGIGISAEAQERLFSPFAQEDVSTTRKFGGTGLGLSIVKKLVELMGGTVGLESEQGKGSEFRVEIPVHVLSESEVLELEDEKLFLMAAEDNQEDAAHLKQLVRSLGWRCEFVEDGAGLISRCMERFENRQKLPDAVIVDWQLPTLNGLRTVEQLKERLGHENLPPVLMVSSYDKSKILHDDKENLIDCQLQKPIEASTLFNGVNEIIAKRTGEAGKVLQSTSSEAIDAKWLSDVTVLVVDDSEINLMVVQSILEQTGANVETAMSGEESISILRERHHQFDAVLMDMQMPGMDGLEATREIRGSLGLAELPIIAFTAGALVEEREKAMKAGMNDFLTKPVEPPDLISVLRKQVERYRKLEIAFEPKPLVVGDGASDSWPVIPGLNEARAKELLLGDKELFLSNLHQLLTDSIPFIELQIDDLDLDDQSVRHRYATLAHKLRSTSGMVGAEEIQGLADEVETVLRSNESADSSLFEKISDSILELRKNSSEVFRDLEGVQPKLES